MPFRIVSDTLYPATDTAITSHVHCITASHCWLSSVIVLSAVHCQTLGKRHKCLHSYQIRKGPTGQTPCCKCNSDLQQHTSQLSVHLRKTRR
jgi:hypothetical protein